MNRWHGFAQLLLTRVREFYREPHALFWVYGFPILLAIGLGLAFANREVPPPRVVLQGHPEQSNVKELEEYLNSHDFGVKVCDEKEAQERLASTKTDLVIEPVGKKFKFYYDKSRAESVLALKWTEDLLVRKNHPDDPQPEEAIKEDPGNTYIAFLIPGLMGLNLMGGGLWGVGFVLVDMRIRKLLKRLLATPMNRSDFLLSILLSRLLFMIPDMLCLLLAGWFIFSVPILGNPVLLALVILVGGATFAGIGLLVACRANRTETVSGLMNLVMLPMWLLCGTFFSAERFPDFMQPVIQALPLTQLNAALREVMLKNHSLVEIQWRLLILVGWGIGSFALALKFFKWR